MFESPKRTTARFLPGSPVCAMEVTKSDEETVGEMEAKAQKAEEDAKKADTEKGKKGKGKGGKGKKKDEPKKKHAKTPLKTVKTADAKKKSEKAEATPKKKKPRKDKEPEKTPKSKGMKRPAAVAGKGESPKKEKLKRPAAVAKPVAKAKAKNKSQDLIRQQMEKMKAGIVSKSEAPLKDEEGEEEAEKEEDPEVEPDEKRNRCKSQKFKRLLKQGLIPAGIQDAMNNCTSRADQTKLVNRLFQKNEATGTWEMQADKPTFQAWLRTSDKSYGKEAKQGYPRSIMVHHYFSGNENAFLEALAAGEVQEVLKNGKAMYTFDSLETGHTKEKDEKMDVNRGVTSLTKDEHRVVSAVLQNFNWNKFGADSPKASASTTKQKQLALTNGPVVVKWKDVEIALTDAKGAHERVLKELNRCFGAAGNSKDRNIVEKFKETMTSLQNNNQTISNCLMFKARISRMQIAATCPMTVDTTCCYPPVRKSLEQKAWRRAKWMHGWGV